MISENTLFPAGTAAAVNFKELFITEGKIPLSDKLSSRLVRCASLLKPDGFAGWQMYIPAKGIVNLSVFGSDEFTEDDLTWIAEKLGKPRKKPSTFKSCAAFNKLYELYLPSAQYTSGPEIGFGAVHNDNPSQNDWDFPMSFSAQFEELVQAIHLTGGAMRITAGSSDQAERQSCRRSMEKFYPYSEPKMSAYLGTPVRVRVLLRLGDTPSIRLRTILNEAVSEAKIRFLGDMSEPEIAEIWDFPLKNAPVLPDFAARIMMYEPVVNRPVTGIKTCQQSTRKIPVNHKNTKSPRAITIGKAVDITGVSRKITIGETDLKRHYQIIGQTGTGKSTILASIILNAIEQGYGLTFFDPHGTTINTVLQSVPEKYAKKIRVVRVGDADNPVPMNIWDSDDPAKEERNIADLCELFGDIFNPPGEYLVVGPRYERWLSTFAKASIAFLGRQASLESIAIISQSQDNMLKVSKAICNKYPELVEIIKNEYGLNKSNDFHDTLNWLLSKFQRFTSVEQLRKTLGAGANALDFPGTIDTDTVTLIDLGSPVIGTTPARLVGTVLLMKLWNAVRMRNNTDLTHLLIIDEASLFQTNPMPRMLAESRKFGLSLVLSHQNTSQLTENIRDALESNSANLSAFRLSPKDAAMASYRFDHDNICTILSRLDAFNAVTTISVDGKQTPPFTLETIPTKINKNSSKIADMIEKESIRTLVEPYRSKRALTSAEILQRLDKFAPPKEKPKPENNNNPPAANTPKTNPAPDPKSNDAQNQKPKEKSFLDKWMERKKELEQKAEDEKKKAENDAKNKQDVSGSPASGDKTDNAG